MLKNRILSSAIVVAGGLFATTALANTGDKEKMDEAAKATFDQVDQNADGYISRTEFVDSGAFQADYTELDQDNDGRVDQSEFAAFERTEMQRQDQGMGQQQEYDQPTESDFPADPADDPTQSESDY